MCSWNAPKVSANTWVGSPGIHSPGISPGIISGIRLDSSLGICGTCPGSILEIPLGSALGLAPGLALDPSLGSAKPTPNPKPEPIPGSSHIPNGSVVQALPPPCKAVKTGMAWTQIPDGNPAILGIPWSQDGKMKDKGAPPSGIHGFGHFHGDHRMGSMEKGSRPLPRVFPRIQSWIPIPCGSRR